MKNKKKSKVEKFDDFICFDDLSFAEIEEIGVDGVYKDQNTGEVMKVVKEYYQICETDVILYKDDEEVGYADALTLYSNYAHWDADDGYYSGYMRDREDEYVDTDIDYDDIEITNEDERERYSDFKYASDRFNILMNHWKGK